MTVKDSAIVTPDGERFPIRIIKGWSETKEKAANVAANSPLLAGEFTADLDAVIGRVTGDLPDLADILRLDELLSEEADSDGGVEPFDVEEPITRVWVLIGIAAEDYGDHADALEKIAGVEGVFFDSTIR